MTPERQAEMQRSLMTMLGDRSQTSVSEPTPKTNKSRSIKLSSDVSTPPVPPDAVILPPTPPTGNIITKETGNTDVNIMNIAKEKNVNHHYVSDPELENWACTLCTLLNNSSAESCVACETARPW